MTRPHHGTVWEGEHAVASTKARQRKLERARIERRLARQAHHARRKRQAQAGVGAALVLILVVVGTTWLLGGFDSEPETPLAESASCSWQPVDTAMNPDMIDTGQPPASGELRSGFETLTITTDKGELQAVMDLSKVPCTASSLRHLSSKQYYSGVACHELNANFKTLTCGDPKGTGTGSPAYTFATEDVPTEPLPAPDASPSPSASPTPTAGTPDTYYAKGTIVLASGNAGQFMIVYGDASRLPPSYSIIGTLSKGQEILDAVAAAGAVDAAGQPVEIGKPASALTIQQLVVGTAATPSESAAPSESPAPTGTPEPAA